MRHGRAYTPPGARMKFIDNLEVDIFALTYVDFERRGRASLTCIKARDHGLPAWEWDFFWSGGVTGIFDSRGVSMRCCSMDLKCSSQSVTFTK